MRTLLDYIEPATRTKQSGLPCRACDSSDALSIDLSEGDTGVVQCFSCRGGWTGAQYLHEGWNISLHDALVELGARDSDDFHLRGPGERKAARRMAEKRAHDMEWRRKKESACHFGQRPGTGYTALEVQQIKHHMTEEEKAEWDAAKEREKRDEYPEGCGDRLTALFAKLEAQVWARMQEFDRADTHADSITEAEAA